MIVLEKMVDLSPLYISLKTAIITIVITFFLGLFLAKWTLNRKHDLTKIILDGIFTMPLVLPPTVMGFFLLMIFRKDCTASSSAFSIVSDQSSLFFSIM